MDTVKRALWHIERCIGEQPTLDRISSAIGLSRFHLSRIFAEATGRSFSEHVRGRRLSEAARQLADGAPNILTVALDAGYGSHEAFSRAFKDQFGLTPESLRLRADLSSLTLVEPILMTDTPIAIAEPEIRSVDALLLAGLRRFFTYEERGGIPLLWQRFGPHIDHVPDQIRGDAYGVCIRSTMTEPTASTISPPCRSPRWTGWAKGSSASASRRCALPCSSIGIMSRPSARPVPRPASGSAASAAPIRRPRS